MKIENINACNSGTIAYKFIRSDFPVLNVLYTGERVCDVALSSGNPRRVGNLVGRVEGSNGGQRESVYEQPGTEEDDSYHNWRVPSK
jgi:hypothetical protein